VSLETMRWMGGQAGQRPDPEVQRQIAEMAQPSPAWTIGVAMIVLASVCIYAWAVRKMEKALYPRLGALEP
ncbi:hypothetical protein KJ567_04810, partial [Candidatus Bipolaricaulota bacterium]|nr:hypothetical protein [Candidatus Bipolaricaulota bacterium]